MVCVAAFIILCLVGVFVAFLSIFRRDIGRKYWAVFKKAWGCVGKKVRLQKCETNFKDDVKNSLLSRVVLKHPTWVRPLGAVIEVGSVLIVFITIWSLVEAIKALLALWVFGTCNVSQPASCALGAEVCGIDAEAPSNPLEWTGRWFTEWGEIFVNIPDRFQSWPALDYTIGPKISLGNQRRITFNALGEPVLDIFDPGCSICMQSFRNQKSAGLFDQKSVFVMVYVIEADGQPKFNNSDLIARYIYAAQVFEDKSDKSPEYSYAHQLIDRLFTGSNDQGINNQSYLISLSREDAEKELKRWLKDFGLKDAEIKEVAALVPSDEISAILAEVKDKVENQIHAKGIPTMLYDGRKHSGLWKESE